MVKDHTQSIGERDLCIFYLRRGAPEAFKVLFFEHYSELFSFSLMLVQRRPAARKAVIEAFFQLWDQRELFDDGKKVKAFLYLTIRNTCLQMLRSRTVSDKTEVEGVPSSLPADVLGDIFDHAARTH
jgi:RNA polymerase sigma-70 factor (ECF subfamily)